jgi:hypothetical protein
MKTITIPTNYNNKLQCRAMVHIAVAPKELVPESKLGQVYAFSTVDGSVPEVLPYKLVSLVRVKLAEMPMMFTWPSHGMDNVDFIFWYKDQYQVDLETEMGVYYYEQVPVVVEKMVD